MKYKMILIIEMMIHWLLNPSNKIKGSFKILKKVVSQHRLKKCLPKTFHKISPSKKVQPQIKRIKGRNQRTCLKMMKKKIMYMFPLTCLISDFNFLINNKLIN